MTKPSIAERAFQGVALPPGWTVIKHGVRRPGPGRRPLDGTLIRNARTGLYAMWEFGAIASFPQDVAQKIVATMAAQAASPGAQELSDYQHQLEVEHGVSVAELAAHLGRDNDTLTRWIKGETPVPEAVRKQVAARAIAVEDDELVTRSKRTTRGRPPKP